MKISQFGVLVADPSLEPSANLFRRLYLHFVVWTGTRNLFTLRKLVCFRYALVVSNALLWKEARLVTCFVGLCAMGDG